MGERLIRAGIKDVERCFKKVGMEMDHTGDIVARFVVDGVQVVMTKVSGGRGDIPTWVLGRIKSQLRLSVDQFNSLVSCPLKRDGLIQIYKGQGQI